MDRQRSVVLVDDDEDTRELLRAVFEADERFVVAGEAADGASAVRLVAAARPDVLVVDLQLPVIAGLRVIDGAQRDSPATRIVVFTAFPDPFTLLDVLGRGGHALLNKATAWSELVPTIIRLCESPVDAFSG